MAVANRRLSNNFVLSEVPGWDHPSVTEAQVERLEETVARVLQPIRTRFGVPVYISSWTTWRDGELRDGSHAHGGTVDFVVGRGRTREAFEWAAANLVPAGYIGRLIYEPTRDASPTTPQQGEHIHLAPREAMLEAFGDPAIQVLEEEAEGEYRFFRTAATVGAAALALVAGWLLLAGRQRMATT